ncbi:MAG: hypothetical protein ACE5KU_03480, partial [Nitrososphaerales archaeon]
NPRPLAEDRWRSSTAVAGMHRRLDQEPDCRAIHATPSPCVYADTGWRLRHEPVIEFLMEV